LAGRARLRPGHPLCLDRAQRHVVDHPTVREQVVGLEDQAILPAIAYATALSKPLPLAGLLFSKYGG
jgi:hypothetical protein